MLSDVYGKLAGGGHSSEATEADYTKQKGKQLFNLNSNT